MARGSFCSQLCYYLSFSWCWHRESRQEGVEPNQSKESLLLNLDDERHWSSNKNIGTKINDHYRFSDSLLSIGENNLPILTQANEFESIVLDPPQLPEESDKKFIVRYDAEMFEHISNAVEGEWKNIDTKIEMYIFRVISIFGIQ